MKHCFSMPYIPYATVLTLWTGKKNFLASATIKIIAANRYLRERNLLLANSGEFTVNDTGKSKIQAEMESKFLDYRPKKVQII